MSIKLESKFQDIIHNQLKDISVDIFDPSFIHKVVNIVEQEFDSFKNSCVSKKELAYEIIDDLVPLTDSEKRQIDKVIDFICQNGLVKQTCVKWCCK